MAKNKPSFEEMKEIYENWSNYDKTGTQAEVFKKMDGVEQRILMNVIILQILKKDLFQKNIY